MSWLSLRSLLRQQPFASTSTLIPTRSFSTSLTPLTWGGGKLKTHQGTAKRFRAVPKPRPHLGPIGYDQYGNPLKVRPFQGPPILFKRARAGKSHLNRKLSGRKLSALGGTKIVGTGRFGVHLRRLLAGQN